MQRMLNSLVRMVFAIIAMVAIGALTTHVEATNPDAYALSFDGSGDYVTMGEAPGLGAETFTIETWFIRLGAGQVATSGAGGVDGIPLVTKGRGEADGSNLDANYFLAIRSSDNVIAADFEDMASGQNHPVAGVTTIEQGVWYHAAATYDGSVWRLYLNGGLEAETNVNATPRADSVQHFGFATALNSSGTPDGFLDGMLDEVRVWDHARTQQEIMDNMNAEIESAAGLLGRWGLNEGTGSVAGDSSGNGNDGTLMNAMWAPGLDFAGVGSGLLFDGSNDHVAMGQAPGLGTETFTLETWFRRLGPGATATSGAGGVLAEPLVTKGRGEADGNNLDANYFFGIRESDLVLAADFEDLASGQNHPVAGSTPIGDDNWHHAAATYDGSTWRLYLDGALDAELTVNATPRADSLQHFGLATALDSNGNPAGAFNGVLDEARVWNYARTQQEIMDSMNDEIPSEDGLLGRWGLNEGSGGTAGDSTGNGNDGAIAGAVWVQGQKFADVLTVQTGQPVTKSETSATLNGQLTNLGGETEASVYFQWGDSPDNLDQSTPTQTLSATGSFSETLTGLPADSLFYFQAVAEGDVETAQGDVREFVVTDDFGLAMNGVSDYVTMGSAPGLGSETFTLETWFKRTGSGQPSNTGAGGFFGIPLVTKGRGEQDGSNLDMNYFMGIRESDNVLGADFEDLAEGLNHPVFGTTPIQNDTWYHAAATYDGTTWRLYLNGQLEVESDVNATPRADSIQHFGLGTALTSGGSPMGYLEGVLDEARVWDYARTQQEIQDSINSQIEMASGLLGRWGLNEGSGDTANDSTGNGNDGEIVGSTWTLGAPFNLSLPPDQPMVIAPADGGTVDTVDVDLTVNVSDPDGDTLDVTYYGRQVTQSAGDPFSIVALPDTQFYSESFPDNFTAQTQWIVDNVDTMNIAFVPHLGDIVQTASVTGEWENADAAISILETVPDLPFGLCVGNHDQDPEGDPAGTENFNTYFPSSRFEDDSWYGGQQGTNNDNHYILFSAGGMDFIAIHLEYDTSPDQKVLDWAETILQENSDRRAIICSHYIIQSGNPGAFSGQGAAIYDAVKDHDNVFLMLCGHIIGEGQRVDTFNGNTIHTLLSDYQDRPNGGNGWLRIMEFVPADNAINVSTYSPVLDQFETDANSQFTIPYDMAGEPFTEIGTVMDVASGDDATLTWADREAGAQYEWFVEVSDGASTTTGPTWSFDVQLTPGDLNGDGMVAVDDLLTLLGAWGPCDDPCPPSCTGDIDGDCAVGVSDLLTLLANWG